MMRVNGTRATSRMMKGKLRTVLTSQPRTIDSGRFSSDWPSETRNSRMPSGPPISTAADRPMPSIEQVWPSATHISGSRLMALLIDSSNMCCILPCEVASSASVP
jgi:hypothetical protein